MTHRIAEDLGLRGATSGGPAWLRDNPFLRKSLRTEARRPALYLRIFFTLLVLSAIFIGGFGLRDAFPRGVREFSHFIGISVPTMLFLALSSAHVLFIVSARSAMAISLGVEARRQTLEGLLLTSLQRAEMTLAMAVGPALGALIVALVGLPFYLFIHEYGGMEWSDMGLLYLLFLMLSFAPPTYTLPALSGAVATPETPQLMAARQTARTQMQSQRGGRSWSLFGVMYFFFMMSIFGHVFSFLGTGWIGHIIAALPPSVSRLGPFFFISWPYFATQILGAPLEFFRGHVAPLVYAAPLLIAGMVSSALGTASALTAGDTTEMARLPVQSRHRTAARWITRLSLLCVLAFLWRACILGGDTGLVLGDVTADPQWASAGLLLLMGSLSLLGASGRASGAGIIGKKAGTFRPPVKLIRRTLRLALRPIRVTLALFGAVCLFGWLSPFNTPTYRVLGQLMAAAPAMIIFAIGFQLWSESLQTQAKRAGRPPALLPLGIAWLGLVIALPFAVLSVPNPQVWKLAALSPAAVWLHLFPSADHWLSQWTYWPLGTLPPFALCAVGPVLLGLLGSVLGYRRLAVPAKKGAAAVLEQAPSEKATAPARNAARTAKLLSWTTARTDNPLFTYGIRTRSRDGNWFDWFFIAPALLIAVIGLATFYPDFVSQMTFTAAVHFFRHGFLVVSGVSRLQAYADLTGIALSWQIYVNGFAGLMIGENLIARDQQRGILGFILITPLTDRQIFWGKVWGQTAFFWLGWAIQAVCLLILCLLAAPGVGLFPALTAWLVGETFAAMLFVLGISLGAALATHTLLLKSLRGLSLLLLTAILVGGVKLVLLLLPGDTSGDFFATFGATFIANWQMVAGRLALGSIYCFLLSLPAFLYGLWRIRVLRRRDIPFGDSVPN